MSYEGSMKGSGIDSVDVTLEVECEECGKAWEEDFSTDDWGNVSSDTLGLLRKSKKKWETLMSPIGSKTFGTKGSPAERRGFSLSRYIEEG